MARNSFRIGKAQKRRKRRKQYYWHAKHGHPTELIDPGEHREVFDEGLAFLSMSYLATVLRKRGRKGRNEKEDRQRSEEQEAGKEAARLL